MSDRCWVYGPPECETAAELLDREERRVEMDKTIFCGFDYGAGQSPDFMSGRKRGIMIGVAWALGIEVVVAWLVVLIVRAV